MLEALKLSLVTSTAAAITIVVLGLPVAYLLATRSFRGKGALELLVHLPMVLPPTVGGLALLLAFGRMGLGGRALGFFGLSLPFTTLAVVVLNLQQLGEPTVTAAFAVGRFCESSSASGRPRVVPRPRMHTPRPDTGIS